MPNVSTSPWLGSGRLFGTFARLSAASLLVWQCGCARSNTDADKLAECIVAASGPLHDTSETTTTVASCTPEGSGPYLLVLLPHGQSEVRDRATEGLSEVEVGELEHARQNAPDVTTVAVFSDDGFSASSRLDGVVQVRDVVALRNLHGQPVDLALQRVGTEVWITAVRRSDNRTAREAREAEGSPGLFIIDGAENVKRSSSGLQLSYDLPAVYPADSEIGTLARHLRSAGWRSLRRDALNPGLTTSNASGWVSSIGDTVTPDLTVHEWWGEWTNDAGDLVVYSIKYRCSGSEACDPKPLASVLATKEPSAVLRSLNRTLPTESADALARDGRGLMVLGRAEAVRWSADNRDVSYRLEAQYPPLGSLDELTRWLRAAGWQSLEHDVLRPRRRLSNVVGWAALPDTSVTPPVQVRLWQGQWRDDVGNVVMYSVEYRCDNHDSDCFPSGSGQVRARWMSAEDLKTAFRTPSKLPNRE